MFQELKNIIILFIIFSAIFTGAFFYFLGEKKEIELINLKGYSLLEAINWLQSNSLEVKIFEKSDEALPSLVIISQNPPPGTTVKENRRIALVVNSDKINYLMPNLVGDEISVAQKKLNNIFSQDNISPRIIIQRIFSDEFPSGIVLAQEPQVRTEFNQGNQIVLIVSKGSVSDKLVAKNYRLKEFREVEEELSQLGMIVKAEFQPTRRKANVGRVFEQSISPGEEIKAGREIVLTVGADEARFSDQNSPTPLLQVVEFKIPINEAEVKNQVVLILNDSLGQREIFQGEFDSNALVEYPFSSLGSGILEIYINRKLFKTVEF